MKITMYELLGMIKDGKLKRNALIKISYKDGSVDNYCRWQDDKFVIYYNNGKTETDGCLDIINFLKHNNELIVEILEEEKKIPEKLNDFTISVGRVDDSNIEEYIQTLFEQQYEIFNKINSIIDYLKSEGNE